MVDRIQKTLRVLSAKERAQLLEIIRRIKADNVIGLDVKKLQGRDDVFRVRKGGFRVIFKKNSGEESTILAVERRSDTTYRANG